MTVLPRGLVARRHYAAGAIGLASYLFGVRGLTLTACRAHVSGALTFEEAWPVMRRWMDAVASKRLFRCARGSPPYFTLRGRAERVAATMLSLGAPFAAADEDRVFAGALRAA